MIPAEQYGLAPGYLRYGNLLKGTFSCLLEGIRGKIVGNRHSGRVVHVFVLENIIYPVPVYLEIFIGFIDSLRTLTVFGYLNALNGGQVGKVVNKNLIVTIAVLVDISKKAVAGFQVFRANIITHLFGCVAALRHIPEAAPLFPQEVVRTGHRIGLAAAGSVNG